MADVDDIFRAALHAEEQSRPWKQGSPSYESRKRKDRYTLLRLRFLSTFALAQVVAMSANVPFHPLNAWSSSVRGQLNGFVHGNYQVKSRGLCGLQHIAIKQAFICFRKYRLGLEHRLCEQLNIF